MRRAGRFVAFSLATATCLSSAGIASAQAATRIVHAPVVTFAPGFRILIRAMVVDESPLDSFRCYFREAGQADFFFVDMMGAGANRFVAVLPVPSPATSEIEYVLLAANRRQEVVRTQTFTMTRGSTAETSRLQSRLHGWELVVQTDLARVPSRLPGFADQMVLRGVEPGLRFGRVVPGLYADARGSRERPAGYQGYEVVADAPEAAQPGAPLEGIGDQWAAGASRPGGDIAPPQLIRDKKPRYTVAAMRTKTQGSVVVECVVLTDGTVGPTRLVESLDPDFGLDDEAVAAAKEFRFTPATRNGERVPVVVAIELTFQLK